MRAVKPKTKYTTNKKVTTDSYTDFKNIQSSKMKNH